MKRLLLSLLFTALFVAIMEKQSLLQAACVSQTNGELTAKLTWTNVDTVTTDTINILRSTASGQEKFLINIPYGTSYTDTVPQPQVSVTYFYEIQSQSPGGVGTSAEVCKNFQVAPPAPTAVGIQ